MATTNEGKVLGKSPKEHWVFNCSVPIKEGKSFVEWNEACKNENQDMRWNKMWNDHRFKVEFSNFLVSILIDINQIKSTLKKQENNKK